MGNTPHTHTKLFFKKPDKRIRLPLNMYAMQTKNYKDRRKVITLDVNTDYYREKKYYFNKPPK